MLSNFNKLVLVIFSTLCFSFHSEAQSQPERFIDASLGFGYSFPFDEVDIMGSGFYAEGEYVLRYSKWIDFRPYAGLILATSNDSDAQLAQFGFKSTAQAFMVGGKVRLTFPIPWIAPYLEGGLGASLGSFETITPFTNVKKSGLTPHIPISIGLKIGRKHRFDFSFSYYFHPSAEQFTGSAAFGFSFPLRQNQTKKV